MKPTSLNKSCSNEKKIMPLYYSNFKSFSNKISRILSFEQLLYVALISWIAKVKMALCLVGKAGRGLIWVGFSSVVSQEAPIPLAPCSEAAQPNHANPIPHLGKNPSELCRIIFMIWIKDLLRKETSTKVIKRGTTDQRFYVFPLKNIRSWKVPKHKFCLLQVFFKFIQVFWFFYFFS